MEGHMSEIKEGKRQRELLVGKTGGDHTVALDADAGSSVLLPAFICFTYALLVVNTPLQVKQQLQRYRQSPVLFLPTETELFPWLPAAQASEELWTIAKPQDYTHTHPFYQKWKSWLCTPVTCMLMLPGLLHSLRMRHITRGTSLVPVGWGGGGGRAWQSLVSILRTFPQCSSAVWPPCHFSLSLCSLKLGGYFLEQGRILFYFYYLLGRVFFYSSRLLLEKNIMPFLQDVVSGVFPKIDSAKNPLSIPTGGTRSLPTAKLGKTHKSLLLADLCCNH